MNRRGRKGLLAAAVLGSVLVAGLTSMAAAVELTVPSPPPLPVPEPVTGAVDAVSDAVDSVGGSVDTVTAPVTASLPQTVADAAEPVDAATSDVIGVLEGTGLVDAVAPEDLSPPATGGAAREAQPAAEPAARGGTEAAELEATGGPVPGGPSRGPAATGATAASGEPGRTLATGTPRAFQLSARDALDVATPFGFPFLLVSAIGAFLLGQAWFQRADRRIVGAPVDESGETVGFS